MRLGLVQTIHNPGVVDVTNCQVVELTVIGRIRA